MVEDSFRKWARGLCITERWWNVDFITTRMWASMILVIAGTNGRASVLVSNSSENVEVSYFRPYYELSDGKMSRRIENK